MYFWSVEYCTVFMWWAQVVCWAAWWDVWKCACLQCGAIRCGALWCSVVCGQGEESTAASVRSLVTKLQFPSSGNNQASKCSARKESSACSAYCNKCKQCARVFQPVQVGRYFTIHFELWVNRKNDAITAIKGTTRHVRHFALGQISPWRHTDLLLVRKVISFCGILKSEIDVQYTLGWVLRLISMTWSSTRLPVWQLIWAVSSIEF